jgi:hypothetical protein
MSPDGFSEKIAFNPELDAALDYSMGEMLLPHTCQIFEQDENSKMKPYGSGVMAMLGGNRYLLTASHVADAVASGKTLYIRKRKGYMMIAGSFKVTNKRLLPEIDLAYVRLAPEMTPYLNGGYDFLPLSGFRNHSRLLDAAQYCVVGYPTDSTREVDGQLESVAQCYQLQPAKAKVYEHYGYDPSIHFVLEYKGKGTDIRTGKPKKIRIQPYGLSGCGLWLTLPNYENDSWIIDFKLIGIMTEFRQGKYLCLVGNKIDFLVNLVREFEGLDFTTRQVG